MIIFKNNFVSFKYVLTFVLSVQLYKGWLTEGNVLQLTEVGDYEAQNLNIKIMLNRSRNVDITTEPPILVRCCYALVADYKLKTQF